MSEKPQKTAAKSSEKPQKTAHEVGQDLMDKRRRGRKSTAFDKYESQTREKITFHQQQIADLEAGQHTDKTDGEIRRHKNIVSAYESRLLKRAMQEDLRSQVEARDQQQDAIMQILHEELPTTLLSRVIKRISEETPDTSQVLPDLDTRAKNPRRRRSAKM